MESILTPPERSPGAPELHVLLLAGKPGCVAVADTLRARLPALVTTVAEPRTCLEILQSETVSLLVLEEAFACENAAAVQTMYEAAGGAAVIEVNFGTSNAQRILFQVQAALVRQRFEAQRSLNASRVALQHDLVASASGLLLESQMALRKAGPDIAPQLQRVVALAKDLCRQLQC